MNKIKKGLGRGLSSLIGETKVEQTTNKLSISALYPNKFQPRKIFDENSLSDLEKSIKERGIIQPIIVRKSDENTKYEIIPGQLMTVKIIYDESMQIGIPESSVTIQGKKSFVFIVNNETAEKREVKIGKRNFGKISILSGIAEGEKVVSEGISKVRNKSKVKIVREEE